MKITQVGQVVSLLLTAKEFEKLSSLIWLAEEWLNHEYRKDDPDYKKYIAFINKFRSEDVKCSNSWLFRR